MSNHKIYNNKIDRWQSCRQTDFITAPISVAMKNKKANT